MSDSVDIARAVVRAFFRAAIGCPHCAGTGWQPNVSCLMNPCTHHKRQCFACPAEHVEILFMGETIWADPDKCEWRCDTYGLVYEGVERDECFNVYMGKRQGLHEDHDDCGWQPRWTAITGGET